MSKPIRGFLVLLVLTYLTILGQALAEETDPHLAAMDKSSFRVYCASCHGIAATGNGSVAEFLNVPPADLTKISEKE